VHSKEQINASALAAGRSQLQFSQLGRSSSMALDSAQDEAAVCSHFTGKRNEANQASNLGARRAPKALRRHAPRSQIKTLTAQFVTRALQCVFKLLRITVITDCP